MAMGTDFLVKSLLQSMDPETRAAIEAVPRNVNMVAESLRNIDLRLKAIEEAGTCKRLEAIEIALVNLQGVADGHTIRLAAIQEAISAMRPGYTPDDPLPTFEEWMEQRKPEEEKSNG